MTDTTREHRRVAKAEARGRRYKLSLGELLVPGGGRSGATLPLLVHFHGAPWLAEVSASRWFRRTAVLAVHLGAGSGVYSSAFAAPNRLEDLLDEAARAADRRWGRVTLSSFSAGYGAVREILKSDAGRKRVAALVLADSLHTGYQAEGKPGPFETGPLDPFLAFARQAVAGDKQMVITHSEIFPGTFASTTETADYLLAQLGLKREAELKWGPLGMQQISRARAGGFRLLGFAGNTAPDHMDHLHALTSWLKLVRSK